MLYLIEFLSATHKLLLFWGVYNSSLPYCTQTWKQFSLPRGFYSRFILLPGYKANAMTAAAPATTPPAVRRDPAAALAVAGALALELPADAVELDPPAGLEAELAELAELILDIELLDTELAIEDTDEETLEALETMDDAELEAMEDIADEEEGDMDEDELVPPC